MSRHIELAVWSVHCNVCGRRAEIYVLPGNPYGRLLGRTRDKEELVELDAYRDKLYDEISIRINEITYPRAVGSDCFRSVLGSVYDPGLSDESFDFTEQFRCPSCRSDDVGYGPIDPPETRLMCVPYASHRRWNRLTESEQQQALVESLNRIQRP